MEGLCSQAKEFIPAKGSRCLLSLVPELDASTRFLSFAAGVSPLPVTAP